MALAHWVDADHFDVLRDKINAMVDVVNNIVGVPIGGIQMYFGSPADSTKWDAFGIGVVDTQYEKFALCLGQGLTGSGLQDFSGAAMSIAPDLLGKFPVGFNPGNANFPQIGSTGGEEEVTLTSQQSGVRDHVHNTWSNDGATSYDGGSSGNSSPTVADQVSGPVLNVDGDPAKDGAQNAVDAHNNLPPYLATGFIIRYK
jgi:microcystin-dependent protein